MSLLSRSLVPAASVVAALSFTLAACGSSGDGAGGAASPAPSDRASDEAGAERTPDPDAGGSTTADAADAGADGGEDDLIVVTPKDGGAGFVGAYASPTIVRVGTTYHAYFAKQRINGTVYNVPHATFTEAGTWELVGDALPQLGVQARSTAGYVVWAPAAAQIDATHWVLFYTATLEGTVEKKCIWRARAAGPDGPFVDDFAGPLVCLDASLWAIDPYLVKDAAGGWNLAARLDEPGGINTIQIRALGPEGHDFVPGSTWSKLTENAPTSWEQPVLENAAVVRLAPPSGPAHYFVFYSGGAWADNTYAVGYADCGTTIDGPCVKKTPNGPWLATDAAKGVFGPGTPTFYTNAGGDTRMSVQAWQHSGGKSNPSNDGQIMRTYDVTIDNAYLPTAALVRVDL